MTLKYLIYLFYENPLLKYVNSVLIYFANDLNIQKAIYIIIQFNFVKYNIL